MRVSIELDCRRLSDSEKYQLSKCNALDPELAKASICRSVVFVSDNYVEVFRVKSFTCIGEEYVVSLNAAGAICQFSCKYMVTSISVCKHMFLAQRVMGYSIFYDTRIRRDKNTGEPSQHNPATEPLLIEDEF